MIYQRPDELYHYGVKGMKWGVRRYQNKDGSLTTAGERHRGQRESGSYSGGGSKGSSGGSSKSADRKRKLKKALGLTLGAAAAAGLAYGGYKLHKKGGASFVKNRLHEAQAGYKNSKFGRKVATEKFKAGYLGKKDYAKDVLGRAKNGAVNKAYWLQEKGSLYGQKAKSGLKSMPTKAKDLKNKAKIKYYLSKTDYYLNGGAKGLANRTGNRIKNAAAKAGSGAVNKAYWLQEKGSLYGQKAKSRLSSAASNYRSARDERRLTGDNLTSRVGRGIKNAGRAVSATSSSLRSEVAARGGLGNIAKRTAGRAASGLGRGIERTGRAVNATSSRLRSEVAARGGVSAVARSAVTRRKRRRQANRATLSRF